MIILRWKTSSVKAGAYQSEKGLSILSIIEIDSLLKDDRIISDFAADDSDSGKSTESDVGA